MNTFEVYLIENLDRIIAMLIVAATLTGLTGIAVFTAAVVKISTEGDVNKEALMIAIRGIVWGIGIALMLFGAAMLLPSSQKMARIVIVPKVASKLYMTEDKSVDNFVQYYINKEAYKEKK